MLPLAQRIMHSQVHLSIGLRPLQILLGNAIDMDRILIPNKSIASQRQQIETINNISYQDLADKLIERQQTLMNVAIETQLKQTYLISDVKK